MSVEYSLLLPEQPTDPSSVLAFGRIVAERPLRRLWAGQSFNIESHMALSLLGRCNPVPVAIGTALAALRTPYDAALQARSLALCLDRPVSVAYGAADPNFVKSVTGHPFRAPATFTAEYARLVRCLVNGERAMSDVAGLTMDVALPPIGHPPVRVGAGVLRTGMAGKAAEHTDFVASWLTPPAYLASDLIPALRRADGSRPSVATFVACAVATPDRDPHLLVQCGCPHLGRQHYVDMLQKAGLDVHTSDPISGARELVRNGVFVYGSPSQIVARLDQYVAAGVDEIVLNFTPVRLLYGLDEALADASAVAAELDVVGVAR